MNDYLRAIRLATANRFTLLGVLVSSLLVGALWGANIGVVYPFVEVVFGGQSLQEWVDAELQHSREITAKLQAEIEAQQQTGGSSDPARTRSFLLAKRARLQAEHQAQARLVWLRPYARRFLPATPFRTLILIVSALVVGTILKDICIVLNMVLVERLVQLTVFDLRKQFYRQTLRLDLSSFGQHNTSDLLSRFTFDVTRLSSGMSTLFGRAVREPLKMFFCLAGACLISWRLLLFSLLVSPPAIYLMQRLAKSIKRANRRAMEEMSQLYNALTETFSGIQTVKAFTMEPFERSRFHQSAKEFYRKAMKIAFYSSLTKPTTELLGITVISLALLSGAYLVLNQQTHLFGIQMSDRPLSFASLLLFYGFLAGVSDPARKLADIVSQIQGGMAAAERIFAMMDREPAIVDPAQPKTLPSVHRCLSFEGVEFGYRPDQVVLRAVDFQLAFGETLAIVGPNGCGKSTLIQLLLRFYDPRSGVVRMDGIDLRDLRQRDLRRRIGLVTQQTHLFDESVLNNIRYGSPRASDEQVVQAAKRAHAHSFIMERLPRGYATHVGQAGGRLSGGQRQRIALARAILRDPEILILDEATSQIDIESEQLIHHALEDFIRDRTAIMITHRLSTLTLADRVLVMETGKTVDCGTHDELLQRCHLYQRLYDVQFQQSNPGGPAGSRRAG